MKRHKVFLLGVIAGLCLGGCAAPRMVGPESAVRVVVLDATMPPGRDQAETEIVGWWLGARDLHRDPNDGYHWGNLLAEALQRTIPNLAVHSRLDLRTYLAQKEQLLRNAYPHLSRDEIRRLVDRQSPLDFGRSLGADFVVVSRIRDSYLSHQRTFQWWSSVVSVDVEIWDVAQGKPAWSWTGKDRGLFTSVYGTMKGLAYDCARRAGLRGVFATVRPIAPPPAGPSSESPSAAIPAPATPQPVAPPEETK